VAEYEAARLLGLNLATTRQGGYDATEVIEGKTERSRSRDGASQAVIFMVSVLGPGSL
jgi:hypothetical protein